MDKIFKRCLPALAAGVLLVGPQTAGAWGPEGHRVIGAIALDHMNDQAFATLADILGTDDRAGMVEWCNWPDEYRSTEEGIWSYGQHFINMVPGASEYDRERDCPDGMCVTEAIGRYASELADPKLNVEQRRQAFGRVCHFIGDMHQPLHVGFGHDRGGNDFEIEFKGEPSDLHTLWDHGLIDERTENWFELYFLVRYRSATVSTKPWTAEELVSWTNESHALAERRAYPENPEITAVFADATWELALDQMSLGGARLARALNQALAKENKKSRKCRHSK